MISPTNTSNLTVIEGDSMTQQHSNATGVAKSNNIICETARKALSACYNDDQIIFFLNQSESILGFSPANLPEVAKDVISDYNLEMESATRSHHVRYEACWFGFYKSEDDRWTKERNALIRRHSQKLLLVLEKFVCSAPSLPTVAALVDKARALEGGRIPSVVATVSQTSKVEAQSVPPIVNESYSIFINRIDNPTIIYNVDQFETVEDIKSKIDFCEGIRGAEYSLTFEGKTLISGLLVDYGIRRDSNIYMSFKLKGGVFADQDGVSVESSDSRAAETRDIEPEDDEIPYPIFVKVIGGNMKVYSIKESTTVESLKNLILQYQRLEVDTFVLTYGGKTLTGGTLVESGISRNATLFLTNLSGATIATEKTDSSSCVVKHLKSEDIERPRRFSFNVGDSARTEHFSCHVKQFRLEIPRLDNECYLVKISLSNFIVPEIAETMGKFLKYRNHEVKYHVTSSYDKTSDGRVRYGVVFDPNDNCETRESVAAAIHNAPISGVKKCSDMITITIPSDVFSQFSKRKMKCTPNGSNPQSSNYGFLYIIREQDPSISGSFCVGVQATVRFAVPSSGTTGKFPFALLSIDGQQGVYAQDVVAVGNKLDDILISMPILPGTETAVYELGEKGQFFYLDDNNDCCSFSYKHLLWDPNVKNGQYFTPIVSSRSGYIPNMFLSRLSTFAKHDVSVKRGTLYSYVGKTVGDIQLPTRPSVNTSLRTSLVGSNLNKNSFGLQSFVLSEHSATRKSICEHVDSVIKEINDVPNIITRDLSVTNRRVELVSQETLAHVNDIQSMSYSTHRDVAKILDIITKTPITSHYDDIKKHLVTASSAYYVDAVQFRNSLNAVFTMFNVATICDLSLSIPELKGYFKSGDLFSVFTGIDDSYNWPLIDSIVGPELSGLYFCVRCSDPFPGIRTFQCFRIERCDSGVVKCVKHNSGEDVLPRPSLIHDATSSSCNVTLSTLDLKINLSSGLLQTVSTSEVVCGLNVSHTWPIPASITGPDVLGLYFRTQCANIFPNTPAFRCFRIESFDAGMLRCTQHVNGENALPRPIT